MKNGDNVIVSARQMNAPTKPNSKSYVRSRLDTMEQHSFLKNLSQGQLVYVRDDEQGWRPAVVITASESLLGTVTVQLSNGQRVKSKSTNLLLRSENSGSDEISSLTEVTPINEATVLECLHQRFSKDLFYTSAGSTIVAINPFKDVNELYSMRNIWTYYENRDKEVLEPHVYLIADEAYACMKRQLGCVNQSIIVSGESGAGKTVSAKHLLRFLTIVSSPEGDVDLDSSVAGSVIERRVLDSNPLLEAFGNAATPRNDNSSRFGKFIQLQFHRNGTIMGGLIQTYLLEKTRVVHQGTGENNFHIFYQLLSLQDEHQLPAWLEPVKAEIQASGLDCSLTAKGTVDEEDHSLQTTVNAMCEIGISPDTQAAIFQTLLAVLHLTTLKFLPERDGEASGYSDGQETVRAKKVSARLLGVYPERLQYALLNRSIVSGGGGCGGGEGRPSRRSVFHKPLVVAEAESRRDCLAMLLYSKLFDWLVYFINHQIKVDHFDHSIGLLDIYGFEAFEVNSLEQLCINYANERLQQHYVVHFLRDLQIDYEAEGITWKSVAYVDNKNCVEALDGSTGVFGVLNEDVYLNRRGVDHQVCGRIIEACNNNPDLVHKPHAGTYGNQFIISHYAGDVLYTVEGAVTKNKDSIPPELISLLRSSSNGFILQLFGEDQSPLLLSPGQPSKAQRKKTVLTKFKSSLDSLMTSLCQSSVHYIRCIKPNTHSKQGEFDRAFVLQQLRACGTIQTVDICRQGFPARMTYADFVQRYQVFIRAKRFMLAVESGTDTTEDQNLGDANKENENSSTESLSRRVKNRLSKFHSIQHENEIHWQSQRLSTEIFTSVFKDKLLVGVEAQFGHTKIFLTQKQVECLEETRTRVIHSLVCLAQAWWRGRLQRIKYSHARQAALVIQARWRAHSQRQRYNRMKRAATVIQRGWAAHRLRRSLGALSKASRVIKRSLLKWVRRGRFKRALQKLRKQKEKTRETEAAGIEREQKQLDSGAYSGDYETFELRLSQGSIDLLTPRTVLAEVQHSARVGPRQNSSLPNLFVDESTKHTMAWKNGMDDKPLDENYGHHGVNICVDGEGWSEDSGIVVQGETASSRHHDNSSVCQTSSHHLVHHLSQHGKGSEEPATTSRRDAESSSCQQAQSVRKMSEMELLLRQSEHQNLPGKGTETLRGHSGHGGPYKNSADSAPPPAKRPRAITATERELQEKLRGEGETTPGSAKRLRMATRDEGGGGDCGTSSAKRRPPGRRREDLHAGNGVLTCRRLTRSGFRFHVRSSVLKHGHRAHRSYLPHGLPDALSTDDEDGEKSRTPM